MTARRLALAALALVAACLYALWRQPIEWDMELDDTEWELR